MKNWKKDEGVVVVVVLQMRIGWGEEEANTDVDQPMLLAKEMEHRREEVQEENGDDNDG